MTSYLKIKNLHHRYTNTPVLSDINLSLKSGKVLCLLGPSGCGKSTLLKIIAGLENATHGSIYINDSLASEGGEIIIPPEKRNIGLVFQDYALFPHMTVKQNIAFSLKNIPKKNHEKTINDSLSRVSMIDHCTRYPYELSGGQQQRISVARAIAPNPQILLMDEPFSGLDARLRDTIRNETLSIIKEIGAATIIVTHDPYEAMYMADTICLLNDSGAIAQIGTPEELYSTPICAFTANFMSETNTFTGVCLNNKIRTQIGLFSHKGNNQNYKVLVRYEHLEFGDCTPNAKILSYHKLGESTLYIAKITAGNIVYIRTTLTLAIQVGDLCHIQIKKTGTPHIFPI